MEGDGVYRRRASRLEGWGEEWYFNANTEPTIYIIRGFEPQLMGAKWPWRKEP